MKKVFSEAIALFVFFLMAQVGYAAANEAEALKSANDAYRQGDFPAAFSGYEELAKQHPHPDLYYNVGNAAFKRNQLGIAILNYERARRLQPRDPDIITNLNFAKSLVEYRVEDARNWYYRKLMEWLEFAKPREIYFISAIAFFIFVFPIFLKLLIRGNVAITNFSAWTLALWLFTASLSGIKFYQANLRDQAVVVIPKVEVRYGPSEKDKLAFRLVEGIKVSIEDELDQWYRVSLTNGESGWVPQESVMII